MTATPAKTGRHYLWVPRHLQVDVNYLFEGLEGLCVPRTLDSRVGLMEIMVAPAGEAAYLEAQAELLARCPEIKLAGRRPESPA